jgi:hypothetical protein
MSDIRPTTRPDAAWNAIRAAQTGREPTLEDHLRKKRIAAEAAARAQALETQAAAEAFRAHLQGIDVADLEAAACATPAQWAAIWEAEHPGEPCPPQPGPENLPYEAAVRVQKARLTEVFAEAARRR